MPQVKKGINNLIQVLKKIHITMDVSLLENQPFLDKPIFRGANEEREDQFWKTSIPLPNIFFFPDSEETTVLGKNMKEILVYLCQV